jgi:hypothetical protein
LSSPPPSCDWLLLSSIIHFLLPTLTCRQHGSVTKVKGKVVRHEHVWGSGCIDPHFLDLGTSWRWVVSFTPLPPYPKGKSPRYPLERRLGGPQSWSGWRGKEKILDPTRNWTPTPWLSSP